MQGKRIRFGDYEADLGLQELRKCGTRVGLQHKPFHVLELLLRHPGQLVTRQELFDYLWPDSHVSFERGLNSAVNSLRQVLGESCREFHFIETRPGLGYRFIAPVQEVTDTATHLRTGVNPEAYEDCLKGRYLLDRLTEEDTHRALAYFRSATADGIHAPLAGAGMADAYCQLALIESVCPSRVCALARSAAESALSGDPDLAQAHVSAGRVRMLFDWDWKESRQAIEHALQLDPGLVAGQILYASLLCTLGQADAARTACQRALIADPLSFPANLQMAVCDLTLGDFQAVANQCWKMLSLAPGFAPAQLLLARAYEQLDMYEEAIVEFQNAKRCAACRVPATGGLSSVLALAGFPHESEQAYRELSELATERYVSSYWHAVVFAGRKDFEKALWFLSDSIRKHDVAPQLLRTDARFRGMREYESFQQILSHLS